MTSVQGDQFEDSQLICVYIYIYECFLKKEQHSSTFLLYGAYRIVLMLHFVAEQILDNDSHNYNIKFRMMEIRVRGNTLHRV